MDGAERSVSERVIRKVADVTNRDPVELPPLYHSIDPDAVNKLVDSLSSGTIHFTYANQEIEITSRGEIALTHQ
jgi:predicted DNA-binding ArsR family transcriptional regulator